MREALDTVIARLETLAERDEICRPYWAKVNELRDRYLSGEENATQAIFDFLKENASWVLGKKQISWREMIKWWGVERLAAQNIFVECHEVKIDNGFAILYNSSGIFTGHSRILMFGESSGRAYDQCFVSCYDDSKLTAKDCLVYAFGRSRINISGYGKVESWDNTEVDATGYTMVISAENSLVRSSPLATVHQR